MSYEEAMEKYNFQGLYIKKETEFSETIGLGKLISQNIVPGELVPIGTEIILTYALGRIE